MAIKVNFRSITSIIKTHFVEMMIFIVLYFALTLSNKGFFDKEDLSMFTLMTTSIVYSFNNIFKSGKWRYIYYFGWLPFLLLYLNGIDNDWYSSSQAIISIYILSPLIILLSRNNIENQDFINNALNYVLSLIISVTFTGILSLLFFAITISVSTIFAIDKGIISDISVYVYNLFLCIATPCFFFYFRNEKLSINDDKSKIPTILINYICSPAILIYVTILYTYLVKALITWELPNAGIAYLVFGFTIFALTIKSLRETLRKKTFAIFYDNFSIITFPIIILFWAGVVKRISEYGLTDWRVYLVVCGIIMTIGVAMFFSKKYTSYHILTIVSFLFYFIIAFIPNFSAKELAYRSQLSRVEKYATKLNLLDENSKLITQKRDIADTAYMQDYVNLYNSIYYITKADSSALKSYGITSVEPLLNIAPSDIDYYIRHVKHKKHSSEAIFLDFRNFNNKIDISDYNYACELKLHDKYNSKINNYYIYNKDNSYLEIFIDKKPYCIIDDKLILNKINQKIEENNIKQPNEKALNKYKESFATYKNDSLMILFDYIEIETNKNTGLSLKNVYADQIIFK